MAWWNYGIIGSPGAAVGHQNKLHLDNSQHTTCWLTQMLAALGLKPS